MSNTIDNFRDQWFLALLMSEAEVAPQPVIELPVKAVAVPAKERHLSCSMQQLASAIQEIDRILGQRPNLAPEWRTELLAAGKSINFAIRQATSRMRTLGYQEHAGRAP